MNELKSHSVWDAGIRWFHWISMLCVLGLFSVGLAILNAKALGVSTDGKILLKTIHVWIGYVLAMSLFWRLIWAFIGGPYARWRAILPGGHGYLSEIKEYTSALKAGQPRQYLGHNPLGRIAISGLLLLLLVQALTGLVLAGTDLFYPPFGSWIANWVVASGVDSSTLIPYAPEMYDEARYQAMRAFRKPFITAHLYSFYLLVFTVVVHVFAVVFTEVREGGSIISAMFSGKKALSTPPVDRSKAK